MRRFGAAVGLVAATVVACDSEFSPQIQEDLVIRSRFIEYSQDLSLIHI